MHPHRGHRHRGAGLVREPDELVVLDPEVFSRAAELVWDRDNEFACLALDDAFYALVGNEAPLDAYRAYHDEFAKWFCPPHILLRRDSEPWWGSDEHWPLETTNTEARCMALLLMHHIITDGNES
jgi:hypothetical protein